MTKEQIDALIEKVRSWPPEDQDELAELVHEIEARRAGVHILSEEERSAIEEACREPCAPDDDLEAFWKRHGIS
jgi:cell division protein FtsB